MKNLMNQINSGKKNDFKKLNLKKLLLPQFYNTLEDCNKNAFSKEDHIDYTTLDCDKLKDTDFLLYMPEILNATYNKQNIYDSRPMILGDIDLTRSYQKCTFFYRANPFTSDEKNYIEGISYSINLNKTIIACSLKKNLIFPIIIILHLWTFKTPILALKKIQKCKINIDGLTFSSSLLLLKK